MSSNISVNNTTALLSDVIAWMRSPNDALLQRPLGRLITRADTALQYRIVIRCITTQTPQQLDQWRYEDVNTLRGLERRLGLWTMESCLRDGQLVYILHPVPKKEYLRQIRRYTIAVMLRKGLVKDIARKMADDLCVQYHSDWACAIVPPRRN
jgi:hypothetical protein